MIDLSLEMEDLWTSLGPAPKGRGRVVLFVSSTGQQGVSTIAREFARFAAGYGDRRPVWLIDADFHNPRQQIVAQAERHKFGDPGELATASPNGSAFFSVYPPARTPGGELIPDAKYMVARPFLQQKLWITRFRNQNLIPEQGVQILAETDYWDALRKHASYIVVDAPSADRSVAANHLAPLMDGVIIVVSAQTKDTVADVQLKADLQASGARLLGLVFNHDGGDGGAMRRRSA